MQQDEEKASRLAALRATLDALDTEYTKDELQQGLRDLKKSKGYIHATRGKSRKTGEPRPHDAHVTKLDVSPRFFVPDDGHIVRYFLMRALHAVRYDVVLHEFPYQRCLSDVMGVVAGRAIEFEIKASRADYFNDFKKKLYMGRLVDKHGALANGSTMFSRFFFVVPENMVDVRECPKHAGMMWYRMEGDCPVFTVVKAAPMLNRDYLSPGTWQTIAKRLALRNENLVERYVNHRFRDLLKLSPYARNHAANHAADER